MIAFFTTAWGLFRAAGIARILAYAGIGALALGLTWGVGNIQGRMSANAKCEAAALKAQLEVAQRDLLIQREVAQRAQLDRNRLSDQSNKLQKQVDQYEEELKRRRANPACALDDDDIDRLRRFR